MFTAPQLLEFSRQLEEFRGINGRLREVRKSLYLQEVLKANTARKKLVDSKLRWMQRRAAGGAGANVGGAGEEAGEGMELG